MIRVFVVVLFGVPYGADARDDMAGTGCTVYVPVETSRAKNRDRMSDLPIVRVTSCADFAVFAGY